MRSLVDPVWILLLVLTFTVFAKVESTRVNRVIKLLTRVSMSMLLFLSTGVATLIFDQILATETSPNSDWSPEFIFVLGGGYELGANNTQDFLGTESIRRVNAASALWQKYPKSRVVFSANQPGTEQDREPTRHGELSSEHAQSLGLDKARIIIESASSNTREHPIEALKLSGVKRDSLIAIVTSDFHLRRAIGEFKKHFVNVESFGTGDAASGLSWLDFVPLATHLDENAYRIKEFAGIIISKF
ncbi:MAG: YdcF family protein [Ilumatobacteraceae bacterium]